MCGRFTLRARPDALARAAGLDLAGLDLGGAALRPRFNIAPTQDVLAFREGGAVPLRWGLVPSWATDSGIGSRLINARGETLTEKPAFRSAFRHRRCVVAADGFYEWKVVGKVRQPYFLRLAGDRPFAFAGLWERWQGPDGVAVETCAIITTRPNRVAAAVHDRMPAILAEDQIPLWLGTGTDAARLGAMIGPFPAEAMEAHPVSTRVNRPANDDPTLIQPLDSVPDLLL